MAKLTTRGNKLNRLPSTELLDLAIDEGLKVDIDCQLVNCVHADTASMAIDKLKKEKALVYMRILQYIKKIS